MTGFLLFLLLVLLLFLLSSSATPGRKTCGTDSVGSTDIDDDLSSNPFPYTAVRGVSYNVSYDSRALLINSKRVLLQSGIVHYPRSTPAMWPGILRRLREAHLNTVQTYVFWNYHESVQGTWDWSTASRNLSQFLSLAAAEGLFVNLRLGPYVEAEFAHGGLPAYLKAVNGIVFREYNEAWLNATRYYLEYLRDWLQPHLPRNGGNVVLAQVENEYANLAPNKYIEWLTDLAVQLQKDMGIVFYVNVQPNAPTIILDATDQFNPYDFVNLTARVRHQHAMVVESYTGWFEGWYDGHSSRPTEDHSIAVGEFVAAGGTYYSCYMVTYTTCAWMQLLVSYRLTPPILILLCLRCAVSWRDEFRSMGRGHRGDDGVYSVVRVFCSSQRERAAESCQICELGSFSKNHRTVCIHCYQQRLCMAGPLTECHLERPTWESNPFLHVVNKESMVASSFFLTFMSARRAL